MITAQRWTLGAASLLIDGVLRGPGYVEISDGSIVAVVEDAEGARSADIVHDGVVTAGMVDAQVNGAVGVDLASDPIDRWETLAGALAGHGVTAFCPTAITAPLDDLVAVVRTTADAQQVFAGRPLAQPLGAHLEGPYLAPAAAGAHPPRLLAVPSIGDVDRLASIAAATGALAMVTIASELPGAFEAIRRLADAGVAVSLGHTRATAEQAAAAVAAGATWVTHLFNAQAPLHHREPGLIGYALGGGPLTLGLIVDLVHVDAAVVRIAFAAAGSRVALVSDAVAVAGMPPGEYRLGPITVNHRGDGPPRLSDGTLAGSALFLDEAVRLAISVGVDPARALTSATSVPAAGLGDSSRGVLRPGCRADVVCWTPSWHVARTFIAGLPTPAPPPSPAPAPSP